MQLVLNKYGAQIKVHNGMFRIIHQKDIVDIPILKVSSLLVHKAIKLSSDVLMLAIENEIEVVFMTKSGIPIGRVWSHKFGSISNIRKNQIDFIRSSEAVAWIKNILQQKIENQQIILISLQKYDASNSEEIEKTYQKLNTFIDKLNNLPDTSVSAIASSCRGIEGNASKIYFRLINKNLPDLYKFEERSQHPANDMFNAMLNYTYGMLYNHVERALIKAGIDPYMGVFHRNEYNRPVLAFDVIEKYRVWADYVVVDLCMQKVIFPDFFEVKNAAYYLNESGKRIVIQSMNDYLNDVIEMNGMQRTRITHIELWAQNFAQQLKKFVKKDTESF